MTVRRRFDRLCVVNLIFMPVHKRLTDEQIDVLMLELRAQKLRLRDFATQKGIPIPTFRRWFKEWEVKQREARLAALPDKPLAWLPPNDPSGRKGNLASKDPVLTLMVDLADNLGPHTEQAIKLTLCCGGVVVSGRLIGAQEYFAGMQDTVLGGADELMEKYKREAAEAFQNLLPDTERLPERREEWDDFYKPCPYRDAPEFVLLAEATVNAAGLSHQTPFWRGRLGAVSSFWME